jgi:hypothetical protein
MNGTPSSEAYKTENSNSRPLKENVTVAEPTAAGQEVADHDPRPAKSKAAQVEVDRWAGHEAGHIQGPATDSRTVKSRI